jgi:TonB-linked SusC/RagA family outer membrane protein
MVAVIQLWATETYSQLTHLTLKLDDVTISDALKEIENQSDFFFLYSPKLIDVERKVNINAENETIKDILAGIFDDKVKFAAYDRQVILTPIEQSEVLSELQQQKTITGTVSDKKGPIPGVNVVVSGTTTGTITDVNGKYSLEVPQDAQSLTFSFIGMTPQVINIGVLTVIDVTMIESAIGLDEVVVTALGISREKKSLSYAVTEVAGESLTEAKEINLGNALTGRIAGVDASGSATGPGGSTRVIIRGNGSLIGDNQPLYVVNGIPIVIENLGSAGTYGGVDKGNGLASINPDDIESISVLKGGTAAALYGSRAANGVILVTTKSGRARTGIGVEYNTAFTFENPLAIPDWQYEYGSGSLGLAPTSQSEAVANGRISWGSKLDGSMVINPDGIERPYSAQKHNIKNFYDTGTTFSNTLALTGGSDALNFRFSVSNMDVKAIVPNSSVNRKIFNLSTNANLSDKVIFEGKAQYGLELNKNRTYIADFTKNPNAAVGLLATNIDVRTLAPGYDDQGYETPWSDYVFVVNPYFAASKVKNEDQRHRFIGSFSTRYNINEFIYARARLGVDYSNISAWDITPTGILYSPDGSMSENTITSSEVNSEVILGLNKKFGVVSLNIIGGGNKMYRKSSGYNFSSGLFNVPFQYFLTNGKSPSFGKSFRESAINSLFGSADIGYNNYLYLTLSGRQDWFSTLAKESNSLFYPSVGVSFLLSEVWDSKPTWLSYAKARGSWAQVGGGAPDPYGLSLVYVAPSTSHLGQPLMNISGSTIPNVLKPYTSTTIEAGLELRLFNNNLSSDITIYDRTTTNDIVAASVPPSSSYNSVALNVGEIRNRGIEFMLSGSPITTDNSFQWNISLNMAYNKNTVLKIADGLTSLAIPGATARTNNGYVYHFEGQPFGMVSGYSMLKDDNGNIVYNSANGLPIKSAFQSLGRGVPPFTIGLSNDFAYKNMSFGFLLDGKFGGVMYASTNAYGTYYGLDKRTVENGVRESGVPVSGVDQNGNSFNQTVPAETYYKGIAFSITDQFVSKADFIKLRQFTMGYSIPNNMLSNTPFQSVRLSFAARNLFLVYSAIKNVDPESNYSTSNGQGLENFGVPPTRSYGFNLSVQF